MQNGVIYKNKGTMETLRLSSKKLGQSKKSRRQIQTNGRVEASNGGTQETGMVRSSDESQKNVRIQEIPTPQAQSEITRLDFGCGPRTKEGFKGVDCISFPGVVFVMNA